MKRKKIILINGISGLFCQIVLQIMQFLIKIFILRYIGIEIMGISVTFTSILQTLSLAELGFQTAIVFYLYEPLRKKDERKINQILMVLKRIYEVIGIFFILMSLACVPMLKFILKDVKIDATVMCYFIIMSVNISFTYFIAYKRALLLADQKEYVAKFVDCIFTSVMSLLKIAIIILFRSYLFFLILQVVQTIGSNVVIQLYCKKKYPYIHSCRFEMSILKVVGRDVKNVFTGKLAGYVYGATDNLIISSVIGTVCVGYMSNYIVFISAMKQIVSSMFYSMTSIVGNMLAEKTDMKREELNFRMYTYARYVIASVFIIPWVLFSDDAIEILFGRQYILPRIITWLLAVDLYVHVVYTPCCEYIGGRGCFRMDKNIAIVGVCVNIVSSLAFAYLIGIEGVLIGTVLSQLFFWGSRSCITYFKIFRLGQKEYIRYVLKNVWWMAITLLQILFFLFIKSNIHNRNDIVALGLQFVLYEFINCIVQIIVFHTSEEQILLYRYIKQK